MADNDPSGGITDADIDALLAEMNKSAELAASAVTPAVAAPAPTPAPAAAADAGGPVDQSDIDALLNSATFADADSGGDAPPAMPVPGAPPAVGLNAAPLDLPDLQRAMVDAQVSSIDLLRDVELNVKIELGRSKMLVEDVLKLAEGSVVELDKLAGDPVDVYVNERLVARGEVLVLNESFCVRVNEIVAGGREDA
jgi:flagellar motor switch protein FliN/FliY